MSEEFFLDREFYLGDIGGDIISGNLRFGAGGEVSGWSHQTAAGWKVEADTLFFTDESGAITCSFGRHHSGEKQYVLRGVDPDDTLSRLVLVRKDDIAPGNSLSALRTTLYSDFTPFNFVDESYVDTGYPHTHLSEEIAAAIISVVRPRFWLEVGSMLGGSAIRTANVLKRLKSETEIVCIDPFCGDVNMWSWERSSRAKGEWQFLRLERGRPTIYDRFLANVTAAGHADIILPITATSIVGMKLLRRLFFEGRLPSLPEVIYLDSAHEADETLLELKSAWQTLRDGSILFGDDWGWPAIRKDVTIFAESLPQNEAYIEKLRQLHPDFEIVDNVLLDAGSGHWILAK